MLYDCLLVLSNVIQKHNLTSVLGSSLEEPCNCDNERKWNFGSEFMNYIKKTNFTGIRGRISFDKETGSRPNVKLS
jgi:hypothetical protein